MSECPRGHPTDAHLAYAGSDQQLGIQVLDVVTGETRTLSGTNNGIWPRWSPDGTTIVYLGTNADGAQDLFTIDVNGGAPHNLTNDEANEMPPVWSPDGSLIAFAADNGSSSDIFVIDSDGGNLRNVSNQPADVIGPSWSPDGTRIAFNSHPSGIADIYITDLTTRRHLQHHELPGLRMYAVWSPDGETIAYTRGTPENDGLTHLWLMDADGSNRRELIADDAYATIYAVWSPDSEQVAAIMLPFERRDTVAWSLIVVNRDGSNARTLTERAAELDAPAWRPGTSTAVMLAIPVPEPTPSPTIIPSRDLRDTDRLNGDLLLPLRVDGHNRRLFVMPADGSPTRQLIPERTIEGDQWGGVWSPDGRQVAVTVQVGSSADIYIVDADGSNLRQLAAATSSEPVPANWVWSQSNPAWSPDGSTIAFDSNRAFDRGGQDIYSINADGTNLQRLTDSDMFESGPRWSPDGSRLAFTAIGSSRGDYGSIFVMNADGSNQRQLVDVTGAGDPNWSPDGEWIAFSTGRFSRTVISSDQTEPTNTRLSRSTMSGRWPRWSPDGALLAWIAHDDEGSFDGIVVYDLEAGDDHLITGVSGVIEWSPDGAWIAVAMPERDLSGNETGAGGIYRHAPRWQRDSAAPRGPGRRIRRHARLEWNRPAVLSRVIAHLSECSSHSRATGHPRGSGRGRSAAR